MPEGLNDAAKLGLAQFIKLVRKAGCQATVACNTISLLQQAAEELLGAGDGNAVFALTIPEVVEYARTNNIVVLGTDAFMGQLSKTYGLNTFLDLHPNENKLRSLVQEIIWRQKAAVDHVYVPPELFDEIDSLDSIAALEVKVLELVRVLKEDGLQAFHFPVRDGTGSLVGTCGAGGDSASISAVQSLSTIGPEYRRRL